MWSYYGSKSKLVRYYPKPKHDLIVEPFGGTAKYSLEFWDHNVIITEKYNKIYEIWKYLQSASPKDILSLPDIGYHEVIPTSLSKPEQWLIGYCVGRGVPRPCTKGHKFNSWNKDKIRIASSLYKIQHWDIRNDDYTTLNNDTATWFIDPPYQSSGYKYNYGNSKIDYTELSQWCRDRKGQVLVCENGDADWLPFVNLKSFSGAFRYKDNAHSRMEVLWQKE